MDPQQLMSVYEKVLQLLGDFVPQTPYRGFAPGPHWGTSVFSLTPTFQRAPPPLRQAGSHCNLVIVESLVMYVIRGVHVAKKTSVW